MLSRERYVIVAIIALAAVVGVALSHAFQWTWVQLGWDDPYILGIRQLLVTRAISGGIALAAAIFCLKHQPTYQLAIEVVDELSKVTWPSRDETGNATVVVIVTVFICAAYLGVFDAVWLALTDWVLGIPEKPEG